MQEEIPVLYLALGNRKRKIGKERHPWDELQRGQREVTGAVVRILL